MQQALVCEILAQGTRPCGVIGAIEWKEEVEGFLLFIHGDGLAFTMVPQLFS